MLAGGNAPFFLTHENISFIHSVIHLELIEFLHNSRYCVGLYKSKKNRIKLLSTLSVHTQEVGGDDP